MKIFENMGRFTKNKSSVNPSFFVYQYTSKELDMIRPRSTKLFCVLSKCALRRARLNYKHIWVRIRVPALKFVPTKDLARAATVFSDVVAPLYVTSMKTYVPQSVVATASTGRAGKKVMRLPYVALVAEKDSKIWERTAFILVLRGAPERPQGR